MRCSLSPSFEASSVSAASSASFFSIASSPFAARLATYEVFGSALRRSAMTAPSLSRISASLICGSSFVVNLPRVLHDRVGRHPFAAVEAPEETTFAAGVAGDAALLLDLQQHHVFVAVEPQRFHFLHVT